MTTGRAALHALRDTIERQHGVVTAEQLRSKGASPKAIRSLVDAGRLVTAGGLVYAVPGAPDTSHRALWVAVLDLRSDRTAHGLAVVARRAAARLDGVAGFPERDVDMLVHERRNRHAPERRRGLATVRTTSWLPANHVRVLDGLPTTTLARTIFDLAGMSSDARRRRGLPYVHPKRVERCLDTALGRGLDLAAVADVVATLGGRGRPGTALMRRLLDDRSAGYVATESELEDLLLAVLAARGVPLPERQVEVGDDEQPIGRVDFVYRPERLVLEADSRRHHTALMDWAHDRRRDARLAASGWRVIRVTWSDLVDRPDEVAATVRQALRVARAA